MSVPFSSSRQKISEIAKELGVSVYTISGNQTMPAAIQSRSSRQSATTTRLRTPAQTFRCRIAEMENFIFAQKYCLLRAAPADEFVGHYRFRDDERRRADCRSSGDCECPRTIRRWEVRCIGKNA